MHHYAWVFGWRGYKNIHAIGGKSFGFFDTSAKLMSSVLSGCPTIEPTDRLLDENGYPCRLAEKHLGVIAEQIARFTPNCGEGATVMDFCSGTGSAALAGLYMNVKFTILNDKDEKLMDCAMARLRGFVYGLMQSSLWAGIYITPGLHAYTEWDGNDPYYIIKCAVGEVRLPPGSLAYPKHNIPCNATMDKIAAWYELKAGEDQDDNLAVFRTS